MHLTLNSLAFPITMPGKVYNPAIPRRLPHNILCCFFFWLQQSSCVDIFHLFYLLVVFQVIINRPFHSSEQVFKYVFLPHAIRSHEADTEEQKPQEISSDSKDEIFKLRSITKKKKKKSEIFSKFDKHSFSGQNGDSINMNIKLTSDIGTRKLIFWSKTTF